METDELLQLSRRVDWRFLLADPHLGHVATLGLISPELRASLAAFSVAVDELDETTLPSAEPARYDLLVSCTPSHALLHAAEKLLRPEGAIVIEWSNRRWPFSSPTGLTLGRCRAELASLGFDEVRNYWHWPNFASCSDIVPLDDPEMFAYAISKHARGLRAWSGRAAAACLLRSGLLARVLPCVSLVAQRGAP